MRHVLHVFAVFAWYILDAQSAPWLRNGRFCRRRRWRLPFVLEEDTLSIRGGTVDDEDRLHEDYDMDLPNSMESTSLSLLGDVNAKHCSDLVLDLRRRSSIGGDHDESLGLRQLIATRCLEYLAELQEVSVVTREDSNQKTKLPHPKKMLHFLAPKVPAIKHSPDVNLRIHSARSDMDSGVAACVVGSIARLCEMYDKERVHFARILDDKKKPPSAAQELITDRRFEQLVECILSGVNVKKRNREALQFKMDHNLEEAEDIEEILDEDLEESDGLSIRDACRAAWGVAFLGAHHLDSLGGEKVLDLLQGLSLRTRELLLARLKLLRQEDILSERELAHLTTEERMDELAEELAEDAASAMWTFACVRACTGLRSVPLFETCCSILCQDPVEMRRRAQENDEQSDRKNVGNNDVVDRLARSDSIDKKDDSQNRTAAFEVVTSNKDALLDWLSRTQMNDVMWALALHGRENRSASTNEVTLSETASTLGEIAFDRLVEALEEDLKLAEKENEEVNEPLPAKQDIDAEGEARDEQEEEQMIVEVVDAAALLASEAQEASEMSAESIGKLPLESMTLKSHTSDGPVQQVHVVDAAALLASMKGDDPTSIETEIMVSSTQSHVEKSIEDDKQPSGLSEPPLAASIRETSGNDRKFSPHDLAGMAWSVTELQDPLRMQVVPIVIKLIAMLGESGTEYLSGADLANLAWAVSKFEADASRNEAHTPSSLSLSVISWIAHTSLERIRNNVGLEGDSESFALKQFQPPELGRLLWAVACVMSTYAQVPDRIRRDENIHELARVALKTASLHLSLFATEDLVRASIGNVYFVVV